MRFFLVILMLACSLPVFAELYSYRTPDGKLVITDRPIIKDGYKLVDKKVPKFKKDALKKEAMRIRDARRRGGAGGKYRLSKAQIRGLVVPIAKSMKVDPNLVTAVIEIESSRNARAKSNKGAMGLMQLIPETAERFDVTNAWDPRQNVKGGTRYLQYLLSYFEGNVDYVLAAYNAGENAVDRHGGVPPYKETQRYLVKIRKLYKAKTLPYGNQAKRRSALVAKKNLAKPKVSKKARTAE